MRRFLHIHLIAESPGDIDVFDIVIGDSVFRDQCLQPRAHRRFSQLQFPYIFLIETDSSVFL